ncbi:uncharacterized protein YycO [Dysgonomonas sp. PH5-45]|uniref:YiiX/YebB-like N1pC/P60 family cysteine hydrolase n=1 Tax=unclassified Dysgonomonas TaxID=2630389 RepID=UPI00247577FB|nr:MULTISPECIES: YiiX/YebB-like N1pC/P60 family cysteine hydrolase [unclassified Dysgonomonas]MDH6354516.1 uncharacterized protein YycO [Dysgonomonas sp. PH5-45]MDH6387428.1 uncharacterized protein YycO [Dysgonomonas sp. PH5-37]
MKKYTVLFIILVLCACSQQKQDVEWDNIPLAEGDLVFRKGLGTKTRAVLHVDTLGIYSHVGIVVVQDSVFRVVHITPGEREADENVDRIKIEDLSQFWATDRAKNGAVYRLRNNGSGKTAAQQALRLLQKGILFDHDYRLADTTQMYCTQLVWYAYQQAGRDITSGKRSDLNVPLYSGLYILPSDIYTNQDLQLIYKF